MIRRIKDHWQGLDFIGRLRHIILAVMLIASTTFCLWSWHRYVQLEKETQEAVEQLERDVNRLLLKLEGAIDV
jgi:hypothetical protein